jgi:hypothetical protein
VKPYYRSPDGAITVYHARWEDVHAAGLVPLPDLIHADGPYGVNERTDRKSKGRCNARGGAPRDTGRGAPPGRDFPPVHGDDRPFDPAPLLGLDRPLVLWGANHYAPRVPESPSWILWDKKDGTTPDDNADGELAWSNLGGPLRIFRHLWRGTCRASETGVPHIGPTQKPIALSTWIFRERAKLKPGALVFVPYLGSGPDLPAARAMGLRVVACDVERWCCDTAIGRLGVVTPERAAEPCGPLFGGAR